MVAVTGASGAEKTTLVRKVAERLGDATTIFFEDYERSEGASAPRDLNAWLAAGADPGEWSRPCAPLTPRTKAVVAGRYSALL